MRRTYDAARVLGKTDDEIAEIFAKRGRIRDFAFIQDNAFKPFRITRGYFQAYQDLAERKGIPNPLNETVIDAVDRIIDELEYQQLNKDFVINPDDYILKQSTRDQLGQLPPNLPMPNQQVIQTTQMPASGAMNQGLTVAENALLSEEEKMIKLRSRGLA